LLTPLRQVINIVQYGISLPATEEPIGLPIIRMNNLQNDGWDFSDLKYIELSEKDAESYLVHQGDILFNRTNSKELVGKCEVFYEAGNWVFASYLIRVVVNQSQAIPEFVSVFLNTKAGRIQIDRVSRQIIGMSNVNAEELQNLLIPLPPLDIQKSLVAEIEAARQSRKQKLAQADELLSSLDGYLLDTLGLEPTPENEQTVFAVNLSMLLGKRLDALAYKPFYAKGTLPETPTTSLREIANINKNLISKPQNEDELVPYVGLPECNLTEVREVVMRPYKEVKGRNIIRQGDILFARIEPSVFNKKYVLVDDLKGYDYAYTSTEFYVVTAKHKLINKNYLYAMFFCTFVFNQVKGKTTGSSGRRRIDIDLFSALQIPVPSSDIQENIADQIKFRREQAQKLRHEAEAEWETAKIRFEQKLLGEEV
jgi:type I restriction enzyme S subunit